MLKVNDLKKFEGKEFVTIVDSLALKMVSTEYRKHVVTGTKFLVVTLSNDGEEINLLEHISDKTPDDCYLVFKLDKTILKSYDVIDMSETKQTILFKINTKALYRTHHFEISDGDTRIVATDFCPLKKINLPNDRLPKDLITYCTCNSDFGDSKCTHFYKAWTAKDKFNIQCSLMSKPGKNGSPKVKSFPLFKDYRVKKNED